MKPLSIECPNLTCIINQSWPECGWCQQTFCFQKFVDNAQQYLHLHLKQTFPPIIWIITEGEGDQIDSRQPYRIFSTKGIPIKLQ